MVNNYVCRRDIIPTEVLILRQSLIQLRHYYVKELLLLSLYFLRAEWLLAEGLRKDDHLDQFGATDAHYRLIPVQVTIYYMFLLLWVKCVSYRLVMAHQVLQEVDIAPYNDLSAFD
jgi:hypothetical protein